MVDNQDQGQARSIRLLASGPAVAALEVGIVPGKDLGSRDRQKAQSDKNRGLIRRSRTQGLEKNRRLCCFETAIDAGTRRGKSKRREVFKGADGA